MNSFERIPGARLVVPMFVVALGLVILRLLPLPLRDVFVVLFTAILLASAVSPAATALEKYRIPRGVTVLGLYLIGLLALVGVVAMVVPLLAGEVELLRDRLPQYNEDLRRLVARWSPQQAERLTSDRITQRAVEHLAGSVNHATDIAFTISTVGIRLILVLVMAYFMAVEEHFAERVVMRFAPARHRERFKQILASAGNRLGHWARAQLLLAVYFGVAFAIGLRLAGVPYAATLGVVGGVIEIIPYVGGFLTLILAIAVALTRGPVTVAWVGLWYTVVVQTQAHVLAPFLMGRAVGMHPLVVVIALFVGAEALGIFGALLAVPIAVVLQVILDEFYRADPLGDPSTPAQVLEPPGTLVDDNVSPAPSSPALFAE